MPAFFKQWGSFRQEAEQPVKLRPRDPRPGRDEPALLDGVAWQRVPAPER